MAVQAITGRTDLSTVQTGMCTCSRKGVCAYDKL